MTEPTALPALNPTPAWRLLPGYAHGLRQASVLAVEQFASGPRAAAITKALGALVDEITESPESPSPDGARGLDLARALARMTAQLQLWVHIPVSTTFAADPLRLADTPGEHDGEPQGPDRVRLVLPWWRITATRRAYELVAGLWNQLAAGTPPAPIDSLRADARAALSPHTSDSVNEYALVQSLGALGVNVLRLPGDTLCLGTGARARWMSSTLTDRTPAIGMHFARFKNQTAELLRAHGLPGAQNRLVTSEDEALRVAESFGLPVVVKPANLERGEGVAADLRGPDEVRAAFRAARALTRHVLVERHIPGYTHRLTVVEGHLIWARQRVPGGVTGDGRHSIAELVTRAQDTDWSRRWHRTRGVFPVVLDDEARGILVQEGLTEASILPEGQFQRLRRRDNINAGGHNREIAPDEVHPDNRALAVAAAQALRLDIAGIDLIIPDITRSWREVGGGICEVNARPQFAVRQMPDLYKDVLGRLLGPDPHVPADLLIVADDPAARTRLRETIAAKAPARVISSHEGLWRGNTLLAGPFGTGFEAARAAILRADTAALTCLMSVREVLRLGTPVLRWSRITLVREGMSEDDRARLPALRDVLRAPPAPEV